MLDSSSQFVVATASKEVFGRIFGAEERCSGCNELLFPCKYPIEIFIYK